MADQGEVGDIKARKLFRYWTEGPGAIKIGWGVPHDFDRCVTLLTKYFPKDPKGLCANLHHRALGVWPGQEDGGRHGHHEALEALVASAPTNLDTSRPMMWMAPLAPIDQWTSDANGGARKFAPGAITHRDLPLPLRWSREANVGIPHGGAVTVGRITGISADDNFAVAWGDIFPSDTVPASGEMAALARGGVLGLSMDPGGPFEASYSAEFDADGNEFDGVTFTKYHIGAATAVGIPAFAGQRLLIWNDDEDASMDEFHETDLGDEMSYGLIASAEFTVLGTGWENFPVAARQARWSADDAIQRIFAWANGDPKKLAEIYLWRNPKGNANDTSTYRLPIADIINGEPVILYSAVYHAAALLQGGHGGLPDITDQERAALRVVVTRIYGKISDALGVKIAAPWDRAPTRPMKTRLEGEEMEDIATFAVNSSGWSSLPMASPDTTWNGGAAKKALGQRAGVGGDNPNWQKYGQGFLWHSNSPTTTDDFKLPICDVVDGKVTIIPRAVNAVASVLGGGRGGVDIPAADKAQIQSIVTMLQKRFRGSDDTQTEAVVASAPVAPPKEWFENPKLTGKTKITVTPEGRVFGHLADWSTCHLGIQGKCVMAPHSHNDYADFHVGTVVTSDGDVLEVGNLTAGTGHASTSPSLGVGDVRAHYDDTGTGVAVVRAGEDEFGIWVAGSLVPGADDETAALMRRAPLSGDWRPVGGKLSLVAALHVNRPGFQIKPKFSADENGEILALVAAGVLHENLDDTQVFQGLGGGTVVHIPQKSTPSEEIEGIDPQEFRAARLESILNGPARSDRVKRLLGGK